MSPTAALGAAGLELGTWTRPSIASPGGLEGLGIEACRKQRLSRQQSSFRERESAMSILGSFFSSRGLSMTATST